MLVTDGTNTERRYGALTYLQRVLEEHLSRFAEGTTLEGDRELLADTGEAKVSDDWRTALTYRVIQRGACVRACVRACVGGWRACEWVGAPESPRIERQSQRDRNSSSSRLVGVVHG